jgi:PAS domain S-box-containing protein
MSSSSSSDDLIARLPDGLLIVDERDLIRFANPAAAALLGRPADALVATSCPRPLLARQDDPFELTRPDGRRVRLEARVSAVTWDGRPARLAVVREVSPRPSEDALRESEALLRIASRIGRIGAWTVEIPGFEYRWSGEMTAIHGLPPGTRPSFEELFAFCVPADRERIRAAFDRCVREGVAYDEELRIATPDGRQTWVRVIGHAVRDGAGRIVRVQGALQDISERKLAEASVAESAARFRLLSRAANDAIWDWNLTTDELWWNEGYTALFGYPLDEIDPTIRSWTEQIHPDDAPRVTGSIHRAIERGESWSAEYRFRHRDGSYVYVLDRGHVIRDAAGRAVRMVGGMTDITERRRVEDRLRDQATLLDKARDAIVVRDLENRVVYWNRSAEALYGIPADGAIGRPFDAIVEGNPVAVLAATETVRVVGDWSGEIEHVTPSGETLSIECRWTLVRDDDGTPRRILAIDSDVTQRKKLEQQYLRAQRLESIGTLAGGIAHDLNNMLTPILVSTGLLRDGERDPLRLETIDTIERSAQRGAAMVRQVLSFARGVDSQRVEVRPEDAVADIVRIVRDTFPKNIEIVERVGRGLWTLQADPTQLQQVLLNLCVNARDAMPDGGRLTIAVDNVRVSERDRETDLDAGAGPHVCIEIADTGTGIPQAIADKIFDPFFTTKEPGKGTGLGLATSLALVKSHGGFIRFHTSPGAGTRFTVCLPAYSDAAALVDSIAPARLPRGNGETVLLVEDEAAIRQVAKGTLEAYGYQVVTAVNGAEAMSAYIARQGAVDVLLTDMSMPVMDGEALIRVLRRLDPGLPVIAASGNALGPRAGVPPAGPAPHVLPKPYSAEGLLVTLRRALSGSGEAV